MRIELDIGGHLPLFWHGNLGEQIGIIREVSIGRTLSMRKVSIRHTLRDTYRICWVGFYRKTKKFLPLEHHRFDIIIHSTTMGRPCAGYWEIIIYVVGKVAVKWCLSQTYIHTAGLH